MCAAICSERATVPPPGRDCQSATMIHIHTLSQRWNREREREEKQEKKTDTYNC